MKSFRKQVGHGCSLRQGRQQESKVEKDVLLVMVIDRISI